MLSPLLFARVSVYARPSEACGSLPGAEFGVGPSFTIVGSKGRSAAGGEPAGGPLLTRARGRPQRAAGPSVKAAPG